MTQDDAMRYLMRQREFERHAEEIQAANVTNLLRGIRNGFIIMIPVWLLLGMKFCG